MKWKSSTYIKEAYNKLHGKLYAKRVKDGTIKKVFEKRLHTPWHEIALSILSQFDIRGRKVCEVGCGYGVLSIHLNKLGADVTGIDISSKAIEIAKSFNKFYNSRVNFREGFAEDIELQSECFDFVICCECLEHIPDYTKAIDQLIRITKQYGYIIVTVPNVLHPRMLLDSIFLSKQSYEHKFTYFSITRDFSKVAKIIDVKTNILSTKLQGRRNWILKTPLKILGRTVGLLVQRV